MKFTGTPVALRARDWFGGKAWLVWKANDSSAGNTENGFKAETLSVTGTAWGLFPASADVNVTFPV